ALHAYRRDVAGAMRETSRGLSGGSRQAVTRRALVITEVALSLMLLVGSSVLLRAFVAMQRVDLGVDAERILTMRVPLPPQRYPDGTRRAAFFQELLPRIATVPGVAAVGVNSGMHPLGNMWVTAEMSGELPNREPVVLHHVNAAYTSALGIRLAAGRFLTDGD